MPSGRASSARGASGGMFVLFRWKNLVFDALRRCGTRPASRAAKQFVLASVDEANNIVIFRRSPIIRAGNDQPLRRRLWIGAGGIGALLAGEAFGAAES